MTANNGWPGKPGVPLNPERDGWHWMKARSDNLKATWREKFPAQWTAGNRHWIHGTYAPEYAAENWIYLAPVLTPDEVANREDAKWHEGYAVGVLDVRRGTAFGEPDTHYAALQARVAKLEGALRNARARYIELSDKDAAEAMAEIINEALGDVK